MNILIKACPFCGSIPEYHKFYPYDGYQGEPPSHIIKCTSCGASISSIKVVNTIERWNKRKPKKNDVGYLLPIDFD